MATCNFCKDEFQSEQGVKAHMKTCERYLAEKVKKARAASGSRDAGSLRAEARCGEADT